MTIVLTTFFNGVAYGVLLFIMAIGLAVTMGMMRFVNLAHVSLCMLGGYVAVTAMDRFGAPFLLPCRSPSSSPACSRSRWSGWCCATSTAATT